MRFNFKKVSSILASAAMLGSTIGIAAAAAYPAPFVSGSTSDVAIVVGSSAAETDFTAATDIGTNLNAALTGQVISSGGVVTTSGETVPLFTSSSKIYLNDSINVNKEVLTKSDLPTTLADGEFNGNVDSSYTQRIIIGSNPRVIYAKQPTDDEDPVVGIKLGTTPTTQYLYNATVSFYPRVNFTHADSIGESITLFGQKFTVSGSSTSTKLVLLKSSEKLSLSVGGDNPSPVKTVSVEGKTYTVELVSASDTAATIRVTDSNGKSDSKSVNEAESKKIQGLEVAVDNADENNFRLTADVIVGVSKVTLSNGDSVKIGSDDTPIDGTSVQFSNSTIPTHAVDWITVQVAASSDDTNAIIPGKSFVDPVFGSFKVDFPGLNIANDDASKRETIEIKNSGSDKMTISFKDYNGDSINQGSSFNWVYNKSDANIGPYAGEGVGMVLADSGNDRIRVAEMMAVNKSEYVVVGNEDEGGLYEVITITNSSSGHTDDVVELKDVFTGSTVKASITSEGVGTIVLKGKTYNVNYYASPNTLTDKARTIRLNYPDSSGDDRVLYPTIQTKNGAKIAFYEPLKVNISNTFGSGSTINASNFKFPDGDGYTDIAVASHNTGASATIDGTTVNLTAGVSSQKNVNVGKLTYSFNRTASTPADVVNIYLNTPDTGAKIYRPAIVLFEEKDDKDNYEAIVITLDAGYDGDSAGVGVSDVIRTWGADGNNGDSDAWDDIQLETDNDIYKDMDLWGTIATVDKSDTDQATAMISYPDEQVYAQVYFSASSASVSTGGGTGNIVTVSDNEASKISGKNLIVVGGSCVNSIAAELLGAGGKLCGADFTAKTNVGDGEYLIETFSRTGGKVATLVAGYNAADTLNAAKSMIKNKPEITVGKKYKGTTADTLSAV